MHIHNLDIHMYILLLCIINDKKNYKCKITNVIISRTANYNRLKRSLIKIDFYISS